MDIRIPEYAVDYLASMSKEVVGWVRAAYLGYAKDLLTALESDDSSWDSTKRRQELQDIAQEEFGLMPWAFINMWNAVHTCFIHEVGCFAKETKI